MSTTPNLDAMVSRFLAWRLPDDFCPDGFVYFGKGDAKHYGWPTGTNLLNAEQARKMLEHVVGAAENAKASGSTSPLSFDKNALINPVSREDVVAVMDELRSELDRLNGNLDFAINAKQSTAPDQRPKTEAAPATTGEDAENKQLADQFVIAGPNYDKLVAQLRVDLAKPPIETKTYPDGTQATGAAPLPEASPETKGQCNDERACGACFSGQGPCEVKACADGWITWDGGECPVDPETEVRVRVRDGCEGDGVAKAFSWDWTDAKRVWEIIAYRVVQQPAAPAAQGDADWKPNKPIPHRVKITGNGTMGGTFIRDSTTGEPIRCVQSYTITQEKGQLAHAVINVFLPDVELECDAEIRVVERAVKGGA